MGPQNNRSAAVGKPKRKSAVIIGGGFGGVSAAKQLAGADIDVTLIDKSNHHLFQPLLYQVATADLSPADIAWPIRNLLSGIDNISVVLDEAIDVDVDTQQVVTTTAHYQFDYLIIASGTSTSYFGKDEWSNLTGGLKTLADATDLRARILTAFERAEICDDADRRRQLLNFVVVGGGPTGVEMAGAIAELAKAALARDFRHIDPTDARIILVEGGNHLLGGFPDSLCQYARDSLSDLGVEVITGQLVTRMDRQSVWLGERKIETATVIWAAGVKVKGIDRWLDIETDSSGRAAVASDLSLPEHPNIFVIGDAARVHWKGDRIVPGIAPAAKQQGRYVGKLIKAQLLGRDQPPFRYRHAGYLATIGRHRAVVDMGKFKLKGWLAWWFWGLVHIYFLINARSATAVMLQWCWTYLTRRKGARLIAS